VPWTLPGHNVMAHFADKPVLYIRGNLTALTGGAAPTVTLTYMGSK
jgi:hypothetical protein